VGDNAGEGGAMTGMGKGREGGDTKRGAVWSRVVRRGMTGVGEAT
jgi:hypothetical protein